MDKYLFLFVSLLMLDQSCLAAENCASSTAHTSLFSPAAIVEPSGPALLTPLPQNSGANLLTPLQSPDPVSVPEPAPPIVQKKPDLPSPAAASLKRGDAYYKLGKLPNAMLEYDEAVKSDPNEPLAYIGRGLCNFQLRKYQDSANDYTSAIDLLKKNGDPDRWMSVYYANRGESYFRTRQFMPAAEDFSKSIAMNPVLNSSSSTAYVSEADDHKTVGEYEDAARLYRKVLNGDSPEAARELTRKRIATCKKVAKVMGKATVVAGVATLGAMAAVAGAYAASAPSSSYTPTTSYTPLSSSYSDSMNSWRTQSELRDINTNLQNINTNLMFSRLR